MIKRKIKYSVPQEVSNFYSNGFTLLKIKKNESSINFFKACENLNRNILYDGFEWKEYYKTTEDLHPSGHSDSRPSPFKYPFLLDFLFDQKFLIQMRSFKRKRILKNYQRIRSTNRYNHHININN